MEYLDSDGTAVLHCRAHPRRAEIWEVLGHPRRYGEAGRPPPDTAAEELPTGADGSRRPAGPRQPHASDEHSLCVGPLPGGGGGHGGRHPEGNSHGGVLLLHGPAGDGGRRRGALPHQSGHGGPAVRLPDLRLRQPLRRGDRPGQVRPGGIECLPRRRGETGSPVPGSGGLCRVGGGGAAPPAVAGGAAGERELYAPAAHWPAGLCRLYPGPLSLSEGGVRRQRRHCGGCAGYGRVSLPHPGHLPASGGGDGLHELKADRAGPVPSAIRLGDGPARRPD